jgi:hypothetical protein
LLKPSKQEALLGALYLMKLMQPLRPVSPGTLTVVDVSLVLDVKDQNTAEPADKTGVTPSEQHQTVVNCSHLEDCQHFSHVQRCRDRVPRLERGRVKAGTATD